MLAQFVIHAGGRQAVRSSLANEMAELREEQLAGDARPEDIHIYRRPA